MKSATCWKTPVTCACIAVLILCACGKKTTIYVKKTQDIEKIACACKDNACAKLALKDYQALFEELKKNRATGTNSELEQINESARNLQECLKKNRITEKEINDVIDFKE